MDEVAPGVFCAVALILALFFWNVFTTRAQAATWERTTASYYRLWGERTACGKTASPRAWFVASLKADTANCGRRVTLCNRATIRCVRVTVQDRGRWRFDNRRWDLQVRVRDALRCGPLCDVYWKRGW